VTTGGSPQLRLTEVRKAYGSQVVIEGLSLDIRRGELVGVIGPNGAGKTTLFGLIAGEHRPDSGRVLLGTKDVSRFSASQRCRAGIARTFQVPRPFADLSVFENALVGACFGAGRTGVEAEELAASALSKAGLLVRANQDASTLTLLQRKQLEIARAIATDPEVILLDEVAGGLTERETVRLVELVRSLNDGGVTVVWIEHLVHALASVAGRLIVLDKGKIVCDGAARSVMDNETVKAIYLGTDADASPTDR
jgi:branched-chain amino acid transport system ATP-binding protein